MKDERLKMKDAEFCLFISSVWLGTREKKPRFLYKYSKILIYIILLDKLEKR